MRMLTKHAQDIFGPMWQNDDFHESLVPCDVTPVAKWFYSSNPQEEWHHRDDFPRIAPPWPTSWIEFYTPRSVNSQGQIHYNAFSGVKRQGVFVWAAEMEEDSGGVIHPFLQLLMAKSEIDRSPPKKALAPPEARWAVTWGVHLDTGNHVHKIGDVLDFLDDSGRLCSSGKRTAIPAGELAKNMHRGKVDEELASDILVSALLPIEFSLSLAHCNNVELHEDTVPDPVQKKRRKSGKNPGKTFKCLDIDPMKKQSRRESEEGESDVERALHICRGHFKTYTEENPLFGQHTGTYWWPMHVRGNEDVGEVEKSYRVNQRK